MNFIVFKPQEECTKHTRTHTHAFRILAEQKILGIFPWKTPNAVGWMLAKIASDRQTECSCWSHHKQMAFKQTFIRFKQNIYTNAIVHNKWTSVIFVAAKKNSHKIYSRFCFEHSNGMIIVILVQPRRHVYCFTPHTHSFSSVYRH